VTRSDAVVVGLYYGDGEPFSFEAYEIFRDRGEIPTQVGRTDDRGRVVFVPQGPGVYTVEVVSEDGHGAVLDVEVDDDLGVREVAASGLGRIERIWLGVATLFGVFGLMSLWYRRKD
jgi:nickel transport protein